MTDVSDIPNALTDEVRDMLTSVGVATITHQLQKRGDIVVGDAEGAVVIPHALAEEVARDAVAQEDVESFAIERVRAGESVIGLFPLADERRPEYESWAAARKGQ